MARSKIHGVDFLEIIFYLIGCPVSDITSVLLYVKGNGKTEDGACFINGIDPVEAKLLSF